MKQSEILYEAEMYLRAYARELRFELACMHLEKQYEDQIKHKQNPYGIKDEVRRLATLSSSSSFSTLT